MISLDIMKTFVIHSHLNTKLAILVFDYVQKGVLIHVDIVGVGFSVPFNLF